jgi:hypothetical protein
MESYVVKHGIRGQGSQPVERGERAYNALFSKKGLIYSVVVVDSSNYGCNVTHRRVRCTIML